MYRDWTLEEKELLKKLWPRTPWQEILPQFTGRGLNSIKGYAFKLKLQKEINFRTSKYQINTNFFKSWSPKMAWVLGLIYSDGCLVDDLNHHSFIISQNYKNLLETANRAMESNHRIYIRASHDYKTYYHYSLRIWQPQMVEDLKKFGLTPKKSLTVEFPAVPKEYLSHFLRGVFDGDGCVYKKKYDGKYRIGLWLKARITSGSKKFLDGMARAVRQFGIKSRIYRDHACWQICFNDKKFYEWLYKNKGDWFLERKFNRYLYVASLERLSQKYPFPQMMFKPVWAQL